MRELSVACARDIPFGAGGSSGGGGGSSVAGGFEMNSVTSYECKADERDR